MFEVSYLKKGNLNTCGGDNRTGTIKVIPRTSVVQFQELILINKAETNMFSWNGYTYGFTSSKC